jgi:cystathionine gamma-lyase
MNHKNYSFETLAIHAGVEPDPTTGAVMTPVYLTSTYAQSSPGVHKGYEYSRTHNPTRTALQASVAALEGGKFGLAFSSGLSAMTTILLALNSGDHVLCSDDVYGGTYRLFEKVFKSFGLEFSFVDMTDESLVQNSFRKNTKLVWVETPTNPKLKIIDIEKIVSMAKKHHAVCVVDNTFLSPYFQKPLNFGADVVVHSTTKYINGHSDVVGGVIVTSNQELYERYLFLQNAVGAVPAPMDCFLTLRGIKTLPLRMKAHEENAIKITEFLLTHNKVEKVIYPGLKNHPQYEIAKKQMSGFGGMISFYLKGDANNTKKFLENLKLFTLAESLGGVESLVNLPSKMTHASIPKEQREKLGITDTFIRLSVGIENAQDLIEDLKQALQKI